MMFLLLLGAVCFFAGGLVIGKISADGPTDEELNELETLAYEDGYDTGLDDAFAGAYDCGYAEGAIDALREAGCEEIELAIVGDDEAEAA